MSTIQIIICIIVILFIIYMIYYHTKQHRKNDILHKMTQLDKKKYILYSDITQSTILGSSGTTVMGFFKLNGGDRTVKHIDSFTPLLYIESNWYLEISPAPIQKIAARIRIRTNDKGVIKQELIELPQIPKQKWMFIAILRDGRRFDIIYNDKIVASQRLHNYPAVISSSLSIGNKGLNGSVIHVITYDRRLTPTEVERQRLKFVDTNNTVLEDNSIDMSLPAFPVLAQCPPGLPCNPITSPPTNNLLQWDTPYA